MKFKYAFIIVNSPIDIVLFIIEVPPTINVVTVYSNDKMLSAEEKRYIVLLYFNTSVI